MSNGIWDRIFRKPAPVLDRQEWFKSAESEGFVYLPNVLTIQGNDAEDYSSNARYTSVMLQAFQGLCLDLGVHPLVRLQDGGEEEVTDLTALSGLQPEKIGERASGLANSRLVDFDDSKYADLFTKILISMPVPVGVTEGLRHLVLTKIEKILKGGSDLTSNQDFITQFYEALVKAGQYKEIAMSLLQVLSTMSEDGFILTDGEAEFCARVALLGYKDVLPGLVEIYKGTCNG